MAMAASEQDHNYYSQTGHVPHLADHGAIESDKPSEPAGSNDTLPTLPALYYRQSQQYPKRPTITTNFDNHSSNTQFPSSLVADLRPVGASPDPHDFYRPFTDPPGEDIRSTHGGVEHRGGDKQEEAISSVHPFQQKMPFASRANGYVSAEVARQSQVGHGSSSPLSDKSAGSGKGTLRRPQIRGRQSSLQALVNRFEQNQDEVPPVPSNPASRSTSANPSPSSVQASKSFRTRASSEHLNSRKSAGPRNNFQARDVAQSLPASHVRRAENQDVTTKSADKSPRRSRNPPIASTNNAFATQSMTDLSPSNSQPARKPLFGEVIATGTPDLAYGIPGSRGRRGSESNLRQVSPNFDDDSRVSPTSPTAWYMGVTPSLEGINFDSIPLKRPDMHRRSRSDIVASHRTLCQSSVIPNKNPAMLSPPQEQHSSDSSPSQSRGPSRSRLLMKNRRSSHNSSRNTTPSPPASRQGHYNLRSKTSSKFDSHVPLAIQTKTPDHHSRSVNSRRSPRHYNHESSQSSPRLQAIISEKPSTSQRSPPLRSSRPRLPVSSATTSASRARAAANAQETSLRRSDISNKNLPELGGVDLATRREQIQRAFTTKIKEKEKEKQRKRMSLMQDSDWQQGPRHNSSGRIDDASTAPATAPAAKLSFEDLQSPSSEKIETRSADMSQVNDLAVKVASVKDMPIFDPMQEDSPTLGTAPFLQPLRYDGSENSSAETTGTADAFFENDQVQPRKISFAAVHSSRPILDRNASSTSKLGSVFYRSDSAPSTEGGFHESRPALNRNPSSASRFGTAFYASDQDDAESIHIMLQDGSSRPQATATSPQENREPSILQQIDEYDPFRSADSDPTAYASTNADTIGQTNSTSRMARDSDSYNTINRVLEDYHSSFMNPDNVNEFQQKLFAESPQLARQGNWDPKKVTQLYLQNYKPAHSNDVPVPLDPHAKAQIDHISIKRNDEADGSFGKEVISTNSSQEGNGRLRAPGPDAYSHRASASLSNADDWLNTSPSMLDWMAHQQLDTPVEDKGSKPFSFEPREQPAASLKVDKSLPVLPGIQRSSGLGIDITIQSPYDNFADIHYSHDPSDPGRRSSPRPQEGLVRPESPTLRPSTPAGTSSSRQSVSKSGSVAGNESPSRENSLEVTPKLIRSRANTDIDGSSMAESAKTSISASEQKRLNRRRNILKEIVDTESSFGKDMTVVVDIYKGTSNVILDSTEDVKILFGNSAEIVQFSMTFLDSLKQAVKSVYTLPREKRWKTKRDSSATTASSTTTDDQSLSGIDLTDEEKDRKTSVGTAFDINLTQMEKVYTEYLKNHDAANQKLQQLQKSDKVTIWLKECRAYAHDLTTAWDLDSLLVKPVQRILKYPLLLNELLAVTPENHPDYVAIDTAAREMVGVSKRINDAKKRADLVEQVNNSTLLSNKQQRKNNENRLGLPKAFGRRHEKFKQQVGVADTVQDKTYDQIADKFGSHFFQLQVVMRDVEMYVVDSQNWVNRFNEFIGAVESFGAAGQTTYPELESKWQRFRLSVREIQITALTDHAAAVRKNVIDPMTSLLKLHDGPQRLMEKRKKRVMDYAKYRSIKDRGEKPDRKTMDLGEQFVAVNETLKDELPRLFSLTGKLVEACLQNFVQLQLQWMNVWRAKLRQAIETHEIPESFAVIATEFKSDFAYVESQLVPLGICNGSLANDHVNLLNVNVAPLTGTTLYEESRRPSMHTDDSRSRTGSNATIDNSKPRGLSFNNNPGIPAPDFGRASEGFTNNIPYNPSSYAHINHSQRPRASSSIGANKNPIPTENQSSWARNQSLPVHSQPSRPSTGNGRGYDVQQLGRPSYDGIRQSSERLYSDDSLRFGRDSVQSHRQSNVFSSAMPMSDSPRAQSPEDPSNSLQYNVLFLAASVYEFNIDRARREAGYPYLTYVAGEIFDVIGEKGELWLAKNQDDATNQVGWIWNKHFAKLAS